MPTKTKRPAARLVRTNAPVKHVQQLREIALGVVQQAMAQHPALGNHAVGSGSVAPANQRAVNTPEIAKAATMSDVIDQMQSLIDRLSAVSQLHASVATRLTGEYPLSPVAAPSTEHKGEGLTHRLGIMLRQLHESTTELDASGSAMLRHL
ncbi:hypothetical protein [Gemmatimonas sp.]